MVPPGSESAALEILTDFVRKVRAYADEAGKRVGRRILLAHRVPSRLESCFDAGYDVPAWARMGMADMLTLSSWSADILPNARIWRAVLPPETVLNLCTEDACVRPYPGSVISNYDILAGNVAAAFENGFDNFYFFNDCYREGDSHKEYQEYLRQIGSPEGLSQMLRRIPVTAPLRYPGSDQRGVLPVPLKQSAEGCDFARMEQNISFKFPYAGACGDSYLSVGFSNDAVQSSLDSMTARMNGVPLERTKRPALRGCTLRPSFVKEAPQDVAFFLTWKIPAGTLHPGGNVAELLPDPVEGRIVWAEIMVPPYESGNGRKDWRETATEKKRDVVF